MKTWICTIFGGGTPTYIVSAESEKRAWELIKNALRNTCEAYKDISYELDRRSGGLVQFPGWESKEEKIVNFYDIYAPNGTIKKGSYEGLTY